MIETYDTFKRLYDGKYILKFEKINGVVHETYIVVENGKYFIQEYEDFKLYRTIPIMLVATSGREYEI